MIEAGLYHRRWGIETLFKELKVRQELVGKLRGRTPESIHYEIAGHVLLYLLTRWLMVEAGEAYGVDPAALSFVRAAGGAGGYANQTLLTEDPNESAASCFPGCSNESPNTASHSDPADITRESESRLPARQIPKTE